MAAANILVVDDEPDIRSLVRDILQDEGYTVSVAQDAGSAREARRARRFDLALLDVWMPDADGISLLREWGEGTQLPFPVVMMSGHGSVETAVEATKLGAYDFIEKPISLAKLLLTVERALEAGQLKRENQGLREQLPGLIEPAGVSESIRALREQLQRLARHNTWVLFNGEAGAGKSTLARYLHSISNRSQKPFVEVNAAALTSDNWASELFGSEEQDRLQYGRLEQAQGGTLFLDEVAEMDQEAQRRLASALEAQAITRVGGNEAVYIDVRVVATTRRDLQQEVAAGRFHPELYYLLSVVPLRVAPLRERPEDVPELLRYYAEHFPAQENLPYRRFSVAAQNRLRNYPWPGNVRELINLVQRLLILGSGEISVEEIETALGTERSTMLASPDGISEVDCRLPLRQAREQFERAYLIQQLREVHGSVGKLAKAAGMERTHLYRKLRALKIDPKKVVDSSHV